MIPTNIMYNRHMLRYRFSNSNKRGWEGGEVGVGGLVP